ncbi:MAG: hypothetical protein RQ899_01455 [Pseudomonadales bacterium]|nr:hypothetical protein [Pseudomonadales bacterium]
MKSVSLFTAALIVLLVANSALAQNTGSRIEGRPSQPLTIVRFDEPAEIAAIRASIARGEMGEAVAMAESMLAADPTIAIQYFGNNALCVALSAAKDWEGALAACNKAVRIRPGYWMALNSRGTVQLMTGRHQQALADYQKALQALSADSLEADVVRHNIALVDGEHKETE